MTSRLRLVGRCKVDLLRGLKENVILGRLIPAGTGPAHYHDFHMERETYEDLYSGDDEVYFKFEEEDIRSMPKKAAVESK